MRNEIKKSAKLPYVVLEWPPCKFYLLRKNSSPLSFGYNDAPVFPKKSPQINQQVSSLFLGGFEREDPRRGSGQLLELAFDEGPVRRGLVVDVELSADFFERRVQVLEDRVVQRREEVVQSVVPESEEGQRETSADFLPIDHRVQLL